MSFKKTWLDLTKDLVIQNSDKAIKYKQYEDPYSVEVCLILYFYSLELGCPPLYAELNRVQREMDLAYLETLGPIAYSLGEITA